MSLPLAPALLLAASIFPWGPSGVRVNQLNAGSPQIAADLAGGIWVCERDESDPTTASDTPLQHILASGVTAPGWPFGGIMVANTSWSEIPSAVMSDGSSGAFVAFTVSHDLATLRMDVYLQRIAAGGQPAPGWPVGGIAVAAGPSDEWLSRLCSDEHGGVLLAWQDERRYSDNYHPDCRARRITAEGLSAPGWPDSGVTVAGAPGDHWLAQVVSDGAGGAYVVWRDPDYSYAQHLTANGSIAAGWPQSGLRVGTFNSVQFVLDAVSDGAGGLIVAWDDDRERPPGSSPYTRYGDIYAARLRADGTRAPGWPADGLPVCVAPGAQWDARLCPDGTGGALVTWANLTAAGTQGVQRILGTGAVAPGWPSNGIAVGADTTSGSNPMIASDGLGGAYIAWYADNVQNETCWATHVMFDGTLAPGWVVPATRIGDPGAYQQGLVMTATSDGGAAVSYWRYGPQPPDLSTWGVYVQKLGADGIVPAQLSLRDVQATSESVRLTWWGTGAGVDELRVERSEDGASWTELGTPQVTGGDELSYEDRSIVPGARYAYRLVGATGAVVVAAAWVEVPLSARFALTGATPNPARAGEVSVRFSLAERARGTLELLDVGGRRVAWRDVGDLPAGAHEVHMAETASLAPGLYWLRLAQGDRRATSRVAIVR